ncbi:MAG TPA: ABC transporter substrate-binding protein [Burkholderiales bacterium]|nr:ABC transporter substrate-binding protein [Burkholderiales bacterium]
MKILLTLLIAALPVAVAAQQELGPDELVRKVTSEVLDAIQRDKQLQAGDRKKALALAEEKILPLVDFREAARLAVGRPWNTATPEQQERITREFRTLLVRIYSNAIGVYRGQTMRVQPAKMAPGATQVTVRNQYLSPGRPPTSVEYAMHKTPEGWKIYDITVEGVSLVLTYRGEFEQVVRQGGIESLIQRLAERNREPVR